jgi:hypothetical protein
VTILMADVLEILAALHAATALLDLAFAVAQGIDTGLILLALLAEGSRQFHQLRQFPTHFFLDDFAQRDVRHPQISTVCHQGTTCRSTAGIELADTA